LSEAFPAADGRSVFSVTDYRAGKTVGTRGGALEIKETIFQKKYKTRAAASLRGELHPRGGAFSIH